MKTKLSRSPSWKQFRQGLVAIGCAVSVLPGEGWLFAQTPIATPTPAPAVPAELEEVKIPPQQLDSLVAPIALYPDPLLAQTLVAATYPLEIIQLHQWLLKNKDLKDKALADAVAKQPWDPAIQSMAAVPDVVKRLSDDIQWTTELGNAFLAQQSDVMDAVQRMRKKAQDNGALKTSEQQKVETKVIEEKTVIIVEQANPEYIYVPSYSPTVVYGPPYYPYPPIYYPPPPPPGAAFVSFSVGVMFGAAIWGGGWGCGWGHNDVNINVNRNFNNNNINVGGGGGNKWQHNSQHRGAAPYSNKATASKYGGSSTRQSAGAASSRGASAGVSDRSAGASRGGGAGAGTMDRGGSSGASRSASPSASNRSSGASASNRSTGSSGSQIGSRDMGSSSSSRSSGFSGGSSGFSGSSARASSSRGASSFGGSRGGGGGRRR